MARTGKACFAKGISRGEPERISFFSLSLLRGCVARRKEGFFSPLRNVFWEENTCPRLKNHSSPALSSREFWSFSAAGALSSSLGIETDAWRLIRRRRVPASIPFADQGDWDLISKTKVGKVRYSISMYGRASKVPHVPSKVE